MKRIIAIPLSLVLLGAIGILEYLASSPGPSSGSVAPVEFVTPKGATGRSIGKSLSDQGLIKSALVWRWYLWRRGGLKAKAGRHRLSATMALSEIAAALEANPLAEDEPFTVVEGWRLRDVDAALVQAKVIQPGTYVSAASKPADFHAPFPLPPDSLEGFLYPETYRVERDSFDVKKLIQRQLDFFTERFYAPNKDEIAKSGRSLAQLVTMASLVEREEPVPAQRPLIAGILWKRFDKGFQLGVDASSRYKLTEWNDRDAFLKALRDRDDLYNTRLRKGLPPGAIGAPAIDSLLAALRPTVSDYWYYLHDSLHTLHPSKNAGEHERLRAKWGVH